MQGIETPTQDLIQEPLQESKHISPEDATKNIMVDWFKVDYSEEGYSSAEMWQREWGGFPDAYYPALEAHSRGLTVKQYKGILKKEEKKAKKKFGIKGKKKVHFDIDTFGGLELGS